MATLLKLVVGACLASLVSGAPGLIQRGTAYSPRYRISPIDGSKIALPTKEQLAWQDQEIGILIHFEIATYISIDGCNNVPTLVPPQSLFDPTLLSTDQWLDTVASLGAGYATLVAKHNCGFTTWPSTVRFQTTDNETLQYNYTIAQSPVHGENVVKSFVDSAEKYGIGHGFYYSVVVNNFLNVQNSGVLTTELSPGQVGISNDTYDQIVLGQLTDLWTNYGNLTEVGFNSRINFLLRIFVRLSTLITYRSGSMAAIALLK
jgi:alpha-L-fucosidase